MFPTYVGMYLWQEARQAAMSDVPYRRGDVPDFALDDRTARFFGGERLARYDNTGSTIRGGTDFKLLGIEIAELLDAIDNGTPSKSAPKKV